MTQDHLNPEAKAESLIMMFQELALELPADKLAEAGANVEMLSQLLKDYPDGGIPTPELQEAAGKFWDVMQAITEETEDWEKRDIESVKASVAMAKLQHENGAVFAAMDSVTDALDKADNLISVVSPERVSEVEALIAKLEELSKMMD